MADKRTNGRSGSGSGNTGVASSPITNAPAFKPLARPSERLFLVAGSRINYLPIEKATILLQSHYLELESIENGITVLAQIRREEDGDFSYRNLRKGRLNGVKQSYNSLEELIKGERLDLHVFRAYPLQDAEMLDYITSQIARKEQSS